LGYIRLYCRDLRIINDQLLVLCYIHDITTYRIVLIFFNKDLTIHKYFASSHTSAGFVSGYGSGYLGVAVQEGVYEQLEIGLVTSSHLSVFSLNNNV